MQKTAMTINGELALREELEHLIKVVRPSIVDAIATAREHGDLKENAEYHAAREQQSFAEGRIQDIEGKLSNAQVIDISNMPQGDRVIFGSLVTIINMDTEQSEIGKRLYQPLHRPHHHQQFYKWSIARYPY